MEQIMGIYIYIYMEYYGILWNIMEYYGILWNITEYYGILWNIYIVEIYGEPTLYGIVWFLEDDPKWFIPSRNGFFYYGIMNHFLSGVILQVRILW